MIEVFVACGDGTADRRRVSLAEYRDLFDRAAQPGCVDYLIRSGQVNATGVRIKRTELFDSAHWLATGAHKSVGFVHVLEVTAEPDLENVK